MAHRLWITVVACVSLAGACATSEDEPTRNKPGGFADSGSGGSGGGGGAGATGGAGGSGAQSMDASADAALDAEASTDAGSDAVADAPVEASPPDAGSAGYVLLVSRKLGSVTLAHSSGGAFSSTVVTESTDSEPAVTAGSWGGVAVVRATGAGELRSSLFSPQTQTWSAFTAVGVDGWTLATPALAAAGAAQLAFLGTDNKYYDTTYVSGSGWQAFGKVEAGGVHSFGPGAPSLAATTTTRAMAFAGANGNLFTQSAATSWQAAHDHGVGAASDRPPAIVARSATSYVVVFSNNTGSLFWTQGSGTTWTAAAAIPGAASTFAVGLAALAGGDVGLAFRGPGETVHYTQLSGSTWSTIANPYPSYKLSAAPSLAPGLGNRVAELAFVSGGAALTGALDGSGWSAPTPVATGSQLAVAITTLTL